MPFSEEPLKYSCKKPCGALVIGVFGIPRFYLGKTFVTPSSIEPGPAILQFVILTTKISWLLPRDIQKFDIEFVRSSFICKKLFQFLKRE